MNQGAGVANEILRFFVGSKTPALEAVFRLQKFNLATDKLNFF